MDWSALKDFVAVVETGSLSGAARRLKTSQPTVGRRIEQLEQQLDTILFNRSAQGLVLTETGEQILENARRMEEESLAIERMARGANQQIEGTVRISLTECIGIHWLSDKLPEFHTRFPTLRLEVNVNNCNVNLLKREADIAVRMARPKQPDLVTRRAGELRFGLYGSHEYLKQHGKPTQFSHIRNHYHIGHDQEITDYPIIRRFERLFKTGHIVYRSNSHTGQLEATANGLGLGILACFYADRDSRLCRVLTNEIDYSLDVWLVTHTEIAKNVRIRTVFDFLGEELEKDNNLLAGKPGKK